MSAVRLIAVASMLLGVNACSTRADPQHESTGPTATDAEQHAAMENLRLCLMPAAARLDDHQSDASTIAAGLAGACQSQWKMVVATAAKGQSPAFKAGIAAELEKNHPQITLNAVLAERHVRNSN